MTFQRFLNDCITIGLAAGVMACGSAGGGPFGGTSAEPSLSGRELIVRVGQEVEVPQADLRVAFREVAQDSRCPIGVECVWEGNGEVVLALSRSQGASGLVNLNTAAEPRSAVFDGFEIRLLELIPYPVYGERIERGAYTVRIEVRAQ